MATDAVAAGGLKERAAHEARQEIEETNLAGLAKPAVRDDATATDKLNGFARYPRARAGVRVA